jgi:dihydroxy-acid dehydratase
LGGSTNAVLHLLAMAHSIGVDLELSDFTRIGKKIPVLADIKPFGGHFMSELNAIGGIAPMMKTMLASNLLHGDCLTVTGKTLEENLAAIEPYPSNQKNYSLSSKPNQGLKSSQNSLRQFSTRRSCS